jgi:hypothetical protein
LQLCCSSSLLTLKAYFFKCESTFFPIFYLKISLRVGHVTMQNCVPGSGRRTPALKFVKKSYGFVAPPVDPDKATAISIHEGNLGPRTPHFALQIFNFFLIPITRPGTNLSLFTLSLGMCDVCVCASSYLMNFKNSVQTQYHWFHEG